MNALTNLRTWAFAIVAVTGLFAMPSQAEAGDLGMLCPILNAASSSGDLPSCDDVNKAAAVIDCLASGKSTMTCLEENAGSFNNNTIETVIELYVAVRNDDFWGVLSIVGEEALCVIAGIMFPAAGTALCNLVEELVKAVSAVLEAIGEFFADLAEAFWNALKKVVCGVTFGLFGCDSDDVANAPPPAQLVWDRFFARYAAPNNNEISQFIKLYGYSGYYNSKEKQWYGSALSWATQQGYAKADVDQAYAPPFTGVVAAKWGELVRHDMPQLSQTRINLLRESSIKATGQALWIEIVWQGNNYSSVYVKPLEFIVQGCTDRLKPYRHILEWGEKYPEKAAVMFGPAGLKQNPVWCREDFRDSNLPLFADGVVEAILSTNACSNAAGGRLACANTKTRNLCRLALEPFGRADRCHTAVEEELDRRCPPNSNPRRLCPTRQDFKYCSQHIEEVDGPGQRCSFTPAVANGEADGIRSALTAAGSKIPCNARYSNAINQTSGLICSRPRQQVFCRAGSDSRLLSCELIEDPAYVALKQKVLQTVAALNAELTQPPAQEKEKGKSGTKTPATIPASGKSKLKAGGDSSTAQVHASNATMAGLISGGLEINPDEALYVSTQSNKRCENLKKSNKPYGFTAPSTKPGFDYICESPFGDHLQVAPGGVDGLSTPALGLPVVPPKLANPQLDSAATSARLKDIRAARKTVGRHPEDRFAVGHDDITNVLANRRDRVTNVADAETAANITPEQTAGKKLKTAGIGTNAAHAPRTGGFAAGLAGTASAQSAAAPVATPTATSHSGNGTIDIVPAESLRIGGVPTGWGNTVTLGAANVSARRGGACELPVEYGARNAGTGMVSSFRATWTNNTVDGAWSQTLAPVTAGGTRTAVISLPLHPGVNTLTLTLDDLQQRPEINEGNNTARVNANLTDNCGAGATSPLTAPQSPAPGTTLKPPLLKPAK
jgi:hypothetical protein